MKKITCSLLVLLTLGLFSCDKDSDVNNDPSTNPTTSFESDEAKKVIQNMGSSMANDIVDMVNAEGVQALVDLAELLGMGFGYDEAPSDYPSYSKVNRAEYKARLKSSAKMRAYKAKGLFIPKQIRSARVQSGGLFVFDDYKGVYEYDEDEIFVKVEDSDIIIFKFPSKGSATYDAQLRITAYSEYAFTDTWSGNTEYIPSVLKADLIIGNKKYVDFNYSVNFKGDAEPTKGSVSLLLSPITYEISFDNTAAKSAKGNASIKNGSSKILSVDAEVTFDGDKDLDYISKVTSSKDYRGLKFAGTLDVKGLDAAYDSEEEEVDINKYHNYTFSKDGKLLGALVVKEESYEEKWTDYWTGHTYTWTYSRQVFYIKYADGTMEELEELFEPALEEMEKVFVEHGF
jgi:hypothetical protein